MDFSTRQMTAFVITVVVGFFGITFLWWTLEDTGRKLEDDPPVVVEREHETGIDNDPAKRPTIHNEEDPDFASLNRKVIVVNLEDAKNMDKKELFTFKSYKGVNIDKNNITVRGTIDLGEYESNGDEITPPKASVLEYRACDVEQHCETFRVKVQASPTAKKRGE